jgi:Tfp pilus assembly protein PilO
MTGADLLALLKKHPTTSVCLLLSVLCGLAYYFRGDAVEQLGGELAAKTKEAQTMSANIRNSAGLAQQAAEIQEASKQLDARLMKVGQIAINQQFFYRLENDTGVRLVDVRQNPVPPARPGAGKRNFVGVPFSISIQGNFKQVTDFIQRLEHSPHLCRFLNVSMNKMAGSLEGAATNAGGSMSASLSVELLGTTSP